MYLYKHFELVKNSYWLSADINIFRANVSF